VATATCKYLAAPGGCRKGDACPFFHLIGSGDKIGIHAGGDKRTVHTGNSGGGGGDVVATLTSFEVLGVTSDATAPQVKRAYKRQVPTRFFLQSDPKPSPYCCATLLRLIVLPLIVLPLIVLPLIVLPLIVLPLIVLPLIVLPSNEN
jgi:hypothetical protein